LNTFDVRNRRTAEELGLFCENSLLVMVQKPTWQTRKQCCTYRKISNHHYVLVIHKKSAKGVYDSPWFFAKKKWGGIDPLAKNLPDPTVYLNVPHVPNKYKLQDEDGNIVRIPENHVQEVSQLIHQYCPPDGTVLDPCAGSMATLLGAIFLNRKCIANERDSYCYPLAIARAKMFLHFMMKRKGSQFPGLHVPMNTTWDGINIYEAFFDAMGKKTDTSPGCLDVPRSNKPVGFPSDAADVIQANASEGLLVQESPTLKDLEGVTLTAGLFATKAFTEGEFITSLWGDYRLKVKNASSLHVIRIVQNIPKQVELLLKVDTRCAAFYINSPGLHKKTQHILPNCVLTETASDLADSKKMGVFALRNVKEGEELWTVYGDQKLGKLNGLVLLQESVISKANKEGKKEKKSKRRHAPVDQPSSSSSSSSSSSWTNAEKKKKEKLTPEALETAKIAMAQRKIVTEIALSAAATLDAPTLAAALHAKTLKICTPRYNEDEDNDALVSPPSTHTAAHDEDADTDVDPTDGEKDPPERRRSMRVRKRKKPDTETEDGKVSLEGREMMMMMMIGHDRDDVAVLDDDR
jgi:hypothetical protein